MRLKDYQIKALSALEKYLVYCDEEGDAEAAFAKTTKELYKESYSYNKVSAIPDIPYVCIRIPTGGGKTIVGCNAVNLASEKLLKTENPMVLWLTPSDTIRDQTLKAIEDQSHPYNQELRASFGNVYAYDTKDASYIQPVKLLTGANIIVSTIQAFRIEATESRKVYEYNPELEEHFTNLDPLATNGLEKDSNNKPIPSLANLLSLHRPIVIVDEAHNVRTGLSFETLSRFNPSCIIELTATPDLIQNPSNVIYSCSAAELKAEEMIKIPIKVASKADWKMVVHDAIGTLNSLDKIATEKEFVATGERIKPVMLLQAQSKRQGQERVTYEVLEDTLKNDFGIPAEQIAVETDNRHDLKNQDINDPNNPVRFVITVNALAEGWDCPSAYVLCSVADLRSARSVEQLVGRIMRMPKAFKKKNPELNNSYAFVTSASLHDTLNSLEEAVIQNGFNKQEAKEFIRPSDNAEDEQQEFDLDADFGLFSTEITELPDPKKLPESLAKKIDVNKSKKQITITSQISKKEEKQLEEWFQNEENKTAISELVKKANSFYEKKIAPYDRGETFNVPYLLVQQGDLFEPFEEAHYSDTPLDIQVCDFKLEDQDYIPLPPGGRYGKVDVGQQGIIVKSAEDNFIGEVQKQLTLLNDVGWSTTELAYWLDRNINHIDIPQPTFNVFLLNVLKYLTEIRQIELNELVRDKYHLRTSIEKRINEFRVNEKKKAYQLFLFESEMPVFVESDRCFKYGEYPYNWRYKGNFEFKKHFYPVIGELKDTGEEFVCAQFLDGVEEVEYWVRNLALQERFSFWLQVSTQRFYPDFVCKLKDGRILVVEYKNTRDWELPENIEKRQVGELWEKQSNGTCLFIMPKGPDFEAVRAKIKK